MFMTPGAAAELWRLALASLGGDDDKPWTAESIFVSGSMVQLVEGLSF